MLIIGGLGAAAYLAATGFNTKNAVFNLDYLNPKIKVGKVGLGSTDLQMTIDFRNNSSQDIAMEYFTGYINYKGKAISSFTFDGNGKNIVIKKRAITTVPLTVIIKNFGALQTLKGLFTTVSTGQKIDTVINIDSRFYAAGIDIPVKFDWDLKTNSLVTTSNKVSGVGGLGYPDKSGSIAGTAANKIFDFKKFKGNHSFAAYLYNEKGERVDVFYSRHKENAIRYFKSHYIIRPGFYVDFFKVYNHTQLDKQGSREL